MFYGGECNERGGKRRRGIFLPTSGVNSYLSPFKQALDCLLEGALCWSVCVFMYVVCE
jgi:hypothetical protein